MVKQNEQENQSQPSTKQKPVILMIVDSLMDPPLREAVQLGKAPALQFLMDHGQYYPQLVTSFPTVTPCIFSSLLTGSLPDEHHIYGLTFFHQGENRVVNFGTSAMESLVVGIRNVLRDCLENLNQTFLSPDVKTIHEELDGACATIGSAIYRGEKEHHLKIPFLATLFGILPRTIQTKGPEILSFGALHPISRSSKKRQPWFNYGLNNTFARMELVSLIHSGQLPPLSVVYFPENDKWVHRKGPSQIKGIAKTDQEIAYILEAFGSWEEAINQCTFIVIGDHGQAPLIADKKQAYVDLKKLLHSYSIMPTRRNRPQDSDQLIVCVNERMAYIYVIDEQIPILEVVTALKQESRIDVIAWEEKEWIHVFSGTQNGYLQFRPDGEYSDEYGQRWQIAGDLFLLDITVDKNQQLVYGIYPDVLRRLSGVMNTHPRGIVVTAAPGYEMITETSPTHRGAAHGSLHQLDSQVPLLICGASSMPKHLRMIDMKAWLLELVKGNSKENVH
jgi:predicted AlkP superfamily pyrophosphatase or phosphodiesterase